MPPSRTPNSWRVRPHRTIAQFQATAGSKDHWGFQIGRNCRRLGGNTAAARTISLKTPMLCERQGPCGIEKLIPFHDASTPRSSNFRAQLKRVNCALSRSAIRTTYTTDVLLALTRKSFIDPWGVIYEKVENLPVILKAYSLVDIVKNAGWAVKDTIQDKQVSVVLDSTHMVRFTFHAFRRDFHGLNPVAASKAMRNAVSKPRKFKKSRQPSSDSNNKRSRDAIKKALQPARGLQKSMLLNPNNNIGANTSSATGPFVFGATTGPYSWSAH